MYITQSGVKHGLNEITQLDIYILMILNISLRKVRKIKHLSHFHMAFLLLSFIKKSGHRLPKGLVT